MSQMVDKPSEVKVTFGLKATGEAGIFAITKLGGEANFSVKLGWKHKAPMAIPSSVSVANSDA